MLNKQKTFDKYLKWQERHSPLNFRFHLLQIKDKPWTVTEVTTLPHYLSQSFSPRLLFMPSVFPNWSLQFSAQVTRFPSCMFLKALECPSTISIYSNHNLWKTPHKSWFLYKAFSEIPIRSQCFCSSPVPSIISYLFCYFVKYLLLVCIFSKHLLNTSHT